ncbi:MAG: hypothetical protein IH845_04160 [Nanoarchaeota archaeon]|nr:hypothetical protein [Nanoarchaeota archaeon]
MEIKIITDKKNPFLERQEIVAEINSDVTPSNIEVVEALGKNGDLTVIKKIGSNFGKHIFKVDAYVYDSIDSKDKIETVPQKVRKKMEADKKALEDKAKAEKEAASKAEEEAKAAEAEKSTEEETAPESKSEETTETKKEVKEE